MILGLNKIQVKRANRNLILKIILENEAVSRIDLVKKTGLNKATITNIINEFIDLGIVEEAGFRKKGNERKTKVLKFNFSIAKIISVRITSNFYSMYLYNLKGNSEKEIKSEIHNKHDIQKVIENVLEGIGELLTDVEEKNIIGMCIGLPGPFIRKNDTSKAIVTGFKELSKIDIQKKFSGCFNFPIFAEHDAKLSAFAECKRTINLDNKNKILVGIQTVGVGVGAGIIYDNKIINGSLGIAGEIGHMGINIYKKPKEFNIESSFEYYASTESTKKYLTENLYNFPNSILRIDSKYNEIKQAFLDGDPLAIAVIKKLAWMVGYGIANIIFLLNPDIIIIGSDYPMHAMFLQKIKDSVKQFVHPDIFNNVSIRLSKIEQDTTLLGGYYFIIEKLIENVELIDRLKYIKNSE